MDVNIVYYRDYKQPQRFMELRGKAMERLNSPLN